MSIRTRITMFGIGVTSAVLVLFGFAMYALLAAGADNTQDETLAVRAQQAVTGIASTDPAQLVVTAAGPGPAAVDPRVSVDVFVMVLDSGGAVIASGGVVDGRPPQMPRDVLGLAATMGSARSTVEAAPGVALRVHVRPWSRPELARTGYVVAAQTTRRVDTDKQVGVALVIVYAILTFLVAVPAIWLVAGRALRPLRQLAGLADEIGRSQDLTRRLPPVQTRDALGRLTTSFNTMMARLEEAYRRVADSLAAQRRFTADTSHELRTPLTTIRNNAGFLLRHADAAPADQEAALRDIAGESERMSRLVDNLLALARAEGGTPTPRAAVDLAELAERVCRQARTLHPGRQIHCAASPVPAVTGDLDALAQLLWIMVDNAVKYTNAGGNVWVAVTERGELVGLQVSDDGRGIPPGEQQRIFARFYRARNLARGGPSEPSPVSERTSPAGPLDLAEPGARDRGTGLGLSIAAWIVYQHRGRIVATNNASGGASFVAELPATRPTGPAPATSQPAAPAPGVS